MVLVISRNNYYVDDAIDVSVDNLYVKDSVFNNILASAELRDSIREQLLKDRDCIRIGRVGKDIVKGQLYTKREFGKSNVSDEVSTNHTLRKELGYYARL